MYKEDYKNICAFFKLLKAAFATTCNIAAIERDCGYRGTPVYSQVYIDEQRKDLARLEKQARARLTERNYMPVEPVDYIKNSPVRAIDVDVDELIEKDCFIRSLMQDDGYSRKEAEAVWHKVFLP